MEKRGFLESWAVTHGHFPLVQKFCGGLASAFSNTAPIEFLSYQLGELSQPTRSH
jgi:hypothetical protein